MPRPLALVSLVLGPLWLGLPLPAQQPAPDPRAAAAASSNTQAAALRHAEELLERNDFKAAEPVLADLVKADPGNARLLFDLGFTEEHNGEDAAATANYTAAVAADPSMAEPQVALGLQNARAGKLAEAQTQLRAAANLKSAAPLLRGRALRALARLDQPSDPAAARSDLAEAIQLTGTQPGDAELTASLTATPGDAVASEATLQQILTQHPGDISATVDLASLLQRQGKLPEADALLAPALAAHPEDPRLVAQKATLDAAEGKSADALSSLEKLRSADAQAAANPGLTRLYAHLLLISGDPAKAEPLYRTLAAADPGDPTLLDDLGSTLVREAKFADAQTVLTQAVGQRTAFHDDAAWGDAAGHLAFAASRNAKPEVVLQALEARATVLPNSPATLFLEATAHDTLHHRKEAERAYRAFLAAANGKLPNEEFEARHRLIALEHEH